MQQDNQECASISDVKSEIKNVKEKYSEISDRQIRYEERTEGRFNIVIERLDTLRTEIIVPLQKDVKDLKDSASNLERSMFVLTEKSKEEPKEEDSLAMEFLKDAIKTIITCALLGGITFYALHK